MYAIIEDGGHQVKVAEGESVVIELRTAKAGDAIEFDKVLFCSRDGSVVVGAPFIANAKVVGEVQEEFKAQKLISYKYTRREPYHRKVGHRQKHLRVKVTQISVP